MNIKKQKEKRNVVAKISHNECKDILLNKNYLRHSMNVIPSNNHRTENEDMSWFNDKIYIFANGIHAWALGY